MPSQRRVCSLSKWLLKLSARMIDEIRIHTMFCFRFSFWFSLGFFILISLCIFRSVKRAFAGGEDGVFFDFYLHVCHLDHRCTVF